MTKNDKTNNNALTPSKIYGEVRVIVINFVIMSSVNGSDKSMNKPPKIIISFVWYNILSIILFFC